jgi:hypothetical protein
MWVSAHAVLGDLVYPAGVSTPAQAVPIRLLRIPSISPLAGSAFNGDREHALRPRATLDSSVLSWKGVIPSPREVTVVSGEDSSEGKGHSRSRSDIPPPPVCPIFPHCEW